MAVVTATGVDWCARDLFYYIDVRMYRCVPVGSCYVVVVFRVSFGIGTVLTSSAIVLLRWLVLLGFYPCLSSAVWFAAECGDVEPIDVSGVVGGVVAHV